MSSSSAAAPSASANNVLYYGSWLDDASVMERGSAWLGASSSYWKADAARQVDAPVIMGALGVAPRTQLGISVPVYHFRDDSGLTANGVGTIFMYGKAVLLDPATQRRFGVAIAPLLEISETSGDRWGWALPVNLEVRSDRMRLYGSTGYFSRGSVFGSAALEIAAGPRAAVTGSFGQSHSGNSNQTSLGVSLSYSTSTSAGVFASFGHTSSAAGLNNGGFSVGGGASVSFRPVKARP